jgi:hypothetical protein
MHDTFCIAEAVRKSPAIAEISEMAERAPHLNFRAAYLKAVSDVLLNSADENIPSIRYTPPAKTPNNE